MTNTLYHNIKKARYVEKIREIDFESCTINLSTILRLSFRDFKQNFYEIDYTILPHWFHEKVYFFHSFVVGFIRKRVDFTEFLVNFVKLNDQTFL